MNLAPARLNDLMMSALAIAPGRNQKTTVKVVPARQVWAVFDVERGEHRPLPRQESAIAHMAQGAPGPQCPPSGYFTSQDGAWRYVGSHDLFTVR